jgi:hypothetical protein
MMSRAEPLSAGHTFTIFEFQDLIRVHRVHSQPVKFDYMSTFSMRNRPLIFIISVFHLI